MEQEQRREAEAAALGAKVLEAREYDKQKGRP
jgi:hypothetical protein